MVSDFLMSNVVVSVSYSKRRGRRHILKSPEAQQHQGQGMMLSSCSEAGEHAESTRQNNKKAKKLPSASTRKGINKENPQQKSEFLPVRLRK
jgi:hypothetical protein